MNTNKYKNIEVEGELFIPFKWLDDTPGGENLGRAEFQVCLKSVRGKLKEFWVSTKQQRRNEIWHCQANEYNDFTVNSYEGLDSVGAWLFYPCKEHKAMSFSVYAPTDSRYLQITPSGISFWVNDYSNHGFTKVAKMLTKISNDLGEEADENLIKKLVELDGVK